MATQLLIEQADARPVGANDGARVLAADAFAFVTRLHREFDNRRLDLLEQRRQRQEDIDAGAMPDFLAETSDVRRAEWRVAPSPRDLQDRRVEISGPAADVGFVASALRSGAMVFMADLEDSLSPTWENVVAAQRNLYDAVRTKAEGDAALIVRPRGLHLVEKHVLVDGKPVSASLFDFALYFHHNARTLMDSGSGPYYYLPKLENRLEARWWSDVFAFAEVDLGIPRGTIRATVLIETIHAAFEMDEILYELRGYASGLNAGRWDYIFSFIKTFRHRPELVLPDCAQVTMTAPFMSCCADLLLHTCHRRGAHAIGGQPQNGFDGTCTSDLAEVVEARAHFDAILGDAPHQKHVKRDVVRVAARDMLDPRVPGAHITKRAIENNVDVALRYMSAWLDGRGSVEINGATEDTAAAEIARAQLWQWRRHGVPIAARADAPEGGAALMSADVYRAVRDRQRKRLESDTTIPRAALNQAVELLDKLVLSSDFMPFLTLPGYRHLA